MVDVIPLSIRARMGQEQVDDFSIFLVTIEPNDGTSEPVRLSSDPTVLIEEGDNVDLHGTISRGMTFNWVLMTVQRPDRTRDALPQISLQFEDLEGHISGLLLATTEKTFCTIEEVRYSDPDLVIDSYPGLATSGASGDIMTSTVSLGYDHAVDQELVSARMTEDIFPAIFP